jgi:quinol monooxygenase YgiN
MSTPHPSTVVSLHPYFKLRPGNRDAFLALIQRFIERTSTENACLYYDFTIQGDEIYCREAYIGAAGALAHVSNVGDLLDEALNLAELARLEVHGPASELAQMKESMAPIGAVFFEYINGLVKG